MFLKQRKRRKEYGYDILKKKYAYLREKGFSSYTANRCKFWSDENIRKLVKEGVQND